MSERPKTVFNISYPNACELPELLRKTEAECADLRAKLKLCQEHCAEKLSVMDREVDRLRAKLEAAEKERDEAKREAERVVWKLGTQLAEAEEEANHHDKRAARYWEALEKAIEEVERLDSARHQDRGVGPYKPDSSIAELRAALSSNPDEQGSDDDSVF